MKGQDLLETLLARIAAAPDGTVFVSAEEMAAWPKTAVSVLKAEGLLLPASPATSVVCDGCERFCAMPVEISRHRTGNAAFVACDRRDDISRVDVPLGRLERWQSSGEAVAIVLARILGVHRPARVSDEGKRWPVGVLRARLSAHVELNSEPALTLTLAGHHVPVTNILTLKGNALIVNRAALMERVDQPVAGGGSKESAADRGAAITRMARDEGVKATAAHWAISPSRVKQITAAHRKRSAAPK